MAEIKEQIMKDVFPYEKTLLNTIVKNTKETKVIICKLIIFTYHK